VARLTAEQWQDIADEREAGISIKELASKYGIHPTSIRKHFKDSPQKPQNALCGTQTTEDYPLPIVVDGWLYRASERVEVKTV